MKDMLRRSALTLVILLLFFGGKTVYQDFMIETDELQTLTELVSQYKEKNASDSFFSDDRKTYYSVKVFGKDILSSHTFYYARIVGNTYEFQSETGELSRIKKYDESDEFVIIEVTKVGENSACKVKDIIPAYDNLTFYLSKTLLPRRIHLYIQGEHWRMQDAEREEWETLSLEMAMSDLM